MANYKFACSTCSQRIAYDENAFGRKIRCPNCKSIITIPVPEGESPAAPIAPVGDGGPATVGAPPAMTPGPKPAGPVAPRAVAAQPGAPRPAAVGGKKSKKGLFIGLGVTLLLAIVGIAAFLTMGGGGESGDGASSTSGDTAKAEGGDASQTEPARDMASSQPATDMSMGQSMGNPFGDAAPAKGGDLAWVPEGSQLLISIQPAELMASPLIAKLLEMQPQAKMGIAAIEGQAGFAHSDIGSILIVANGFDEAAKEGFSELREAKTPSAKEAAGEKMGEDFYAIIRMSKPVDFAQIPQIAALPEVEFQGTTYRRIQPPGGAAPVAIYIASDATVIAGIESGVKKSLATRGKSPSMPKAFESLRPDHQIAVIFSPTAETLELIRGVVLPDELKENPIAGMFAKHMSGGSLSVTSDKSGIAIEATANGDDAEAAKQINDAANEGIAKLPEQMEPFKGMIPPTLAGPIDTLVKSLSSSASGTSVELSATIPNEFFSQEAIGGVMQMAMARGAQNGQRPPRKSSKSAPATRPKAKASEPAPTMARNEPETLAPAASPDGAPMTPTATATAGAEPAATAGGSQPAAKAASADDSPGRILQAWTMNILNAGIPEKPVSGLINGLKFSPESVKIENGVLIMRQGSAKYPDLVVEVHNIQRTGESLDEKKYEMPEVSGVGTPSVTLKWQDPKEINMPTRPFFNKYALKLEFDKMVDGRITGSIFIAVPDGRKSFIAGRFDAEVF